MMSFSALSIAFIVTNILWAGFSIYLNSSWRAAYDDMVDEFMDVLDDIFEKEKEFQPKGDEMR